MEYIIKRILQGNEDWAFPTDREKQEIEEDNYMSGGVVHCLLPKKEYIELQKCIAVLEHRVDGMREAVRRWKKRLRPKEEDQCDEDVDLVHLRTEYVHRRYEDDGRWVCLKHMILRNVEPSEELGQLAYEEVIRLSPGLKKEGILAIKIYFSQPGWICIFDWTSQEPYM